MRGRQTVQRRMLPLVLCVAAAMLARSAHAYKTRNVIIAVMDGVRYSETFGDPKRELIPSLAKLEKEGCLYTSFHDEGVTITRQGHSTIASGTWQVVPNGGPRQTRPALAEYARSELGWPASSCWTIFGKGTYSYAEYSSFPSYGKRLAPSFIIAIGENTPADDDKVLAEVFRVMDSDKPRLIFVNFGVTDHTGHSNKWELYTEAIRHCDEVFGKLWEKVQATPGYKDETTLFFTNDHGRHNDKQDQLNGGFNGHGDRCEGCRHIMLLVVGPDVKKGAVVDRKALQIDIAPTVGELLGFQTPFADGEVLKDCLTRFEKSNKKLVRTPEAKEGQKLMTLAKRDLLKTLSETALKRPVKDLLPSVGTELTMRGMLAAADVTKTPRYRAFVEKWAKAHEKEAADNPHVARVITELAAAGGGPERLDPAKKAAEKVVGAQPGPEGTESEKVEAALRAGLVFRVAELTKDNALVESGKSLLGLASKTEQDLVKEWQKHRVTPPPMACDYGRSPDEKQEVATLADSARLMALADAVTAVPGDRILRLACDLQSEQCTRGLRELGAVWPDDTVSAINLAEALRLQWLRQQHPIQWVQQSQEQKKAPRKPQGPIWAFPGQFYNYCFPFSFDLLKFKVNKAGHYGDGSALADGAALLLFARASGVTMSPTLGATWVRWQQELPPVPKGCVRVVFEFGGGEAATWTGSVSVEKGKLVAFLPYLFEANDQLDEKKRTFNCTTAKKTDGLALDIQGSNDTVVTFACKPKSMMFALGSLKTKQTLEEKVEGGNFVRVTLGK